MKKLLCSLPLCFVMLALAGCNLYTTEPTPEPGLSAMSLQATPIVVPASGIELTVRADTSVPINTVGQVVKFTYTIKNAGTTPILGIISVSGATVVCQGVDTVGNLDGNLDPNEIIICTGDYAITQTDLDRGSIMNTATASVNGTLSNEVVTTVPITPTRGLQLTKTANPTTYSQAGQTITYTYIITNSGLTNLGPAQFIVTDTGFPAPLNCGDANTTLPPNGVVTCSAAYIVTQAELNAASIATSATASGGGAGPSAPASATVAKNVAAPPSPSNLTVGSTIQHKVAPGEWLWQIARCYGAHPRRVIEANPQLADPARIEPDTTVTVPNIGSDGTIYGPPCVATHTVQSGETWNSIAQKYNADTLVLQRVNPVALAPGVVLLVPRNSAGGAQIPITPTAGACIDLARTFKNFGIAHFYICGQTDAGQTRISNIKIFQRPEDALQGALSQDISVSIETSTPLSDPNGLIVEDMNYDGYDDFRIMEYLPAGPNIHYLYYLFVPATRQFVYSEDYRKITSPEFIGNSQIRSQRRNADKRVIDTYTVTNGLPVLTQRETWEKLNETQATHRIIVFNPDGTSQVILEETVPWQ